MLLCVYVCAGGGGLDALKGKLSADGVFYGLMRTSEKIDDRCVRVFARACVHVSVNEIVFL